MGVLRRLARQVLGGVSRRPPAARPPATVHTATGRPRIVYAPSPDRDADPGEIVWTWVPYEDDPRAGKDRPVLVIGRLGHDVAALALTSKRHDDRHHVAIGRGPWDAGGRPSWVKLDRLLQLDPTALRREGAVVPKPTFDQVVAAFERY